MSAELQARADLSWALDETCLAIPPGRRTSAAWRWDQNDLSLRILDDDGELRFHVAAERRGSRKVRIAVMSWEDDNGKVTWEADIPEGAAEAPVA